MHKMQRKRALWVVGITVLVMLSLAGIVGAMWIPPSNDTFTLIHGSISSGSGTSASDTHVLQGVIGQPLVGTSANDTHVLHHGFWQQANAGDSTPPIRTYDGCNNNPINPAYGCSFTQLMRLGPPAFEDGIYEPRGGGISMTLTLPHARTVSNHVADQNGLSIPSTVKVSDMVWQWGQFIDHDIDLTESGDDPFHIIIEDPEDPLSQIGTRLTFTRSHLAPNTGITTTGQHLNEITTWIDASMVYGSDLERANWKRHQLEDGTYLAELKISNDGKNLLPDEEHPEINCDEAQRHTGCFAAGDARANEQIGLTAMHTLFMREHNRLVALIRADNPSLTEDEIYQRARALVSAEIQQITYNEFLPLLLGKTAIPPYTGYDVTVDPRIATEFSTAAFRFGHTMLSPTLLRLNSDGTEIAAGHVPLSRAFFNKSWITNDGIDPILRGLISQQAQAIDPYLIDEVRNLLFVTPDMMFGQDLAARNIQRGRDHGLPSYNDTRRALGLAPASTFGDISTDTEIRMRFEAAYSDVEQVDLWIGGLAEDHVSGALIGETFQHIIADQFTRLRDGDRFWNANTNWAAFGLAVDPILHVDDSVSLDAVKLADILRWNSEVDTTPDNVWLTQPKKLVSIYMIAADNDPASPFSLNTYAPGILNELIAVAVDAPNKTTIILVDFDGMHDTWIYVVENGESTLFNLPEDIGLPNADGEPDKDLDEYDMTNGEQLGGFLKWALGYTDATSHNLLHYIGHGTFIMPDGDYPQDNNRMSFEIGANPEYTDMHPAPSMIAPHDIRQMLEIGTNNGQRALDVVDLTHCFAGTVEQLVELVNPDGPQYAPLITASPSYGYVSESMFGAALRAIDPNNTSLQSARTILDTYLSQTISDGDSHPALWSIISTHHLPAIKPNLDMLAALFTPHLISDKASITPTLQLAQQDAAKYDTTFYRGDWSLDSTDSLVDVRSFMQAIAKHFANDVSIVAAARAVERAVDDATIHMVRRAGTPYWADDQQVWSFETDDRVGMAMFAPFTADMSSGTAQLPWQLAIYSGTAITTTQDDEYPNPYALLKQVGEQPTWATVVQEYWAGRHYDWRADLPSLVPPRQNGELKLQSIETPGSNTTIRGNSSTFLAAAIEVDRTLYRVPTRFDVFLNGELYKSITVTESILATGSHSIQTDEKVSFPPHGATNYEVQVTVDAGNHIQENDESNNYKSTGTRSISTDLAAIITATNPALLQQTSTIAFSQESSIPLSKGVVILKQYTEQENDERARMPQHLRQTDGVEVELMLDGTDAWFELPSTFTGGTYEATIWNIDMNGQLSGNAETFPFNYMPPETHQQAESAFYRYIPTSNEPLTFDMKVLDGSLNWYVWYPSTPKHSMMFENSGAYQVEDPQLEEYVIEVRRMSDEATYTLSIKEGVTTRNVQADPTVLQMDRPIFHHAPLELPTLQPLSVSLVAMEQQVSHTTTFILFAAVVLSLPTMYAVYHRRRTM